MAKRKRGWGPSNPLWRWQHRRGSAKTRSVKTMARRRRRSYPRIGRYGGRLKRRFSKAKVPFEVLIAAGTIPFTPAQSGCMTPMEALQQGNMVELMAQLKSGFLGIDIFGSSRGGTVGGPNIMGLLNPFDMEVGRFSKTLLYAGIIGSIRRKITGRYTNPLFKKIPLIGRIVN